GPLPVALIGAVAVAEKYRGAGLASQVVKVLTHWATEKKAALALLWGSEHTLYQRLGFELVGEQVRVPLSSLKLGSSPAGVSQGWRPALFKALQSRVAGLLLQESDQPWIEA